tara:strand:- start:1598 stop:2065 length:468 start_codon:yes stop_codon:yes gene_type:complete
MKIKISFILFIMYFLQYFFSIKLFFLENLQSIELYKRWSGFILLVLILSQWVLSVLRINNYFNPQRKKLFLNIHKWVGVIMPLFLFFHSTEIGYGVLMLLSFVFYINIVIAIINTEDNFIKYPKVFNVWLILHIFFSVALLSFSLIHVWLVFYYN